MVFHWKPVLFFQSYNSIITKGLDRVDSTHNGIISMITFFRSDGKKHFKILMVPEDTQRDKRYRRVKKSKTELGRFI